MATLAQQEAAENVLKLVEVQQKERNDLNAKHDLELEIVHLRGKLYAIENMEGDGDCEVKKLKTMIMEKERQLQDEKLNNGLEAMAKRLEEKEGELEGLEAVNQALLLKLRESNDEVQEARKELLKGLENLPTPALVGMKRMGELDIEPFCESCKHKLSAEEANAKCIELCSLWKENLMDQEWHPFQIISTNNGVKVMV